MKTCTRCNISKPESEYHKKSNQKLHSHCKDCHKKYVSDHYNRNKQYYLDKAVVARNKKLEWYHAIKSKLQCETCGENHPATLDFHHTDPSKKDFDVASATLRFSKEKIIEEIQKCKILCANCHRKLHWDYR